GRGIGRRFPKEIRQNRSRRLGPAVCDPSCQRRRRRCADALRSGLHARFAPARVRLLHRKLRRRAGPRRRNGAAGLSHVAARRRPPPRPLPPDRGPDCAMGRRRAGQHDGYRRLFGLRVAYRTGRQRDNRGGPANPRSSLDRRGRLRPRDQREPGHPADRRRPHLGARPGVDSGSRVGDRSAARTLLSVAWAAAARRHAGLHDPPRSVDRAVRRSERARHDRARARGCQRDLRRDRQTPARPAVRGRMIGVLLINLGTPDAPDARSVRRYLAEFLSDRRVVEIPSIAWQPILRGIILRTRPRKSAEAYRQVWTDEGSPLQYLTRKQADELAERLGGPVLVRYAMRYGKPAIGATISAMMADGATRILVAPLYPQYSAATTGTAVDAVGAALARMRSQPALRFLPPYYDDPAYIGALAGD